MKYLILVVAAMLSTAAIAEPTIEEVTIKCNWGQLTATSIAEGFPQGPHSADPSGDGKGKGNADNPRKGLGNVVERGNLQATCEYIESLL